MISVEDQIRLAFRELGIEHESTWVWDHIKKQTKDFFSAESLAKQIIERRKQQEPLAYILGEWPFMGVTLKVAPGVLIPRPETEELAAKMVSLVSGSLANQDRKTLTVVDLGAGSGALGIGVVDELLRAFTNLTVTLHSVERSLDARSTLEANLRSIKGEHPLRLNIVTHFCSWNELGDSVKESEVILGNPPYVSELEWRADVDNSVKSFEPRSALTPEPLTDLQKKLAALVEIDEKDLEVLATGPLLENLFIASENLRSNGIVGVEIGPSQAQLLQPKLLSALEHQFKLKLALVKDLSSKLRFLIGYKNG